jgi:hypothetical protein
MYGAGRPPCDLLEYVSPRQPMRSSSTGLCCRMCLARGRPEAVLAGMVLEGQKSYRVLVECVCRLSDCVCQVLFFFDKKKVFATPGIRGLTALLL